MLRLPILLRHNLLLARELIQMLMDSAPVSAFAFDRDRTSSGELEDGSGHIYNAPFFVSNFTVQNVSSKYLGGPARFHISGV